MATLHTFGVVLVTELLKLRRSKVTWLTALALSIIPLVGALFVWIVREPGRARELGLLGQKAELSGLSADWASFCALLLQASGIGGMILASVIAAWVFGREYADGTAKNMLALPVPRSAFVVAKLLVVLAWSAALTLWLVVEGVAVAWASRLPGYSGEALAAWLGDIALECLVVWLLIPAVTWVATLGRGYLAPLGFAIFMLVLGNVFGATGWGKWFPWSIVPLFAGVAGPRTETLAGASVVVLLATFAAGLAATLWQVRHGDNVQ